MNCVELFSRHSAETPDRCALWMTSGSRVTFGELERQASAIQTGLLTRGMRPGTPALVFLDLSAELYATVIALLGLGCPIVLVEPWLSVDRIQGFLSEIKPGAFLTGSLGRLWGLRIPAVRDIPLLIEPSKIQPKASDPRLRTESVSPEHLGILTFTSGTSGGTPKGVTRLQGYLLDQLKIFEKRLQPGSVDWCIFANFAIANLGLGITSLIMDRKWSHKGFKAIADLPETLQPRSLTCGPAFLKRLLDEGNFYPQLQEVHVGGALTDCALFEEAFDRLPSTHFTHVYGSTEAEPVALMDARKAVVMSREQGLQQTLALGLRVPEVHCSIEPEALWVTGPHVCRKYWGNSPENSLHKRADSSGRVWHCMGDRISQSPDGVLWYRGRSGQRASDFEDEQKSYSLLGHTQAFIHRDRNGEAWLLGEGVVGNERELRGAIPGLRGIEELKILRDSRHRARIDRTLSIRKGARWLAG
jgi:olefin beta-lactone synthetase